MEIWDTAVRREAARLRDRIVAGYEGRGRCLRGPGRHRLQPDRRCHADPVDVFIDLIAQTVGPRKLLLKPHPMTPKSDDLLKLYRHFPRPNVPGNIYALLTSPAIEQIVTLSSSVRRKL